MLSMYSGVVIIHIEGKAKNFFGIKKSINASVIPSLGYHINIKAETYEEFEKAIHEIGQYYIDDWEKQLADHLKNNSGLMLTGYDATREHEPFFWTPCFIAFDKITYEIKSKQKLYDFKNKNVQHCMEHLTPEEFKKEFDFLIKTP